MKKEARILLSKAIDSLVLSVEHFNRPYGRGREEAVLVLLDRAFELLMKATIVHKGGTIRERRAKETIGFDHCVRKCVSDATVRCLNEDQALTIGIINSLRDAAQHYILEVSERQLYIYAQAGITLFSDILVAEFQDSLSNHVPERVLPITTSAPQDLKSVIALEYKEVKGLLGPHSRRRLEARAKIRSLAIIDASLRGVRSQPAESDLDRLLRLVQQDKKWTDVFPGVATLKLDTSGQGLSVSIRLTKKEGEAVHLVPEGTPGASIVAIKRVDELGYYSLGLYDIAEKIGLSSVKLLAVIRELRIQSDPEYFKTFRVGSVVHKRYSAKALAKLEEELPHMNLDEVWERQNPARKRKV